MNRLLLSIPTHRPRRRGFRLLAAISTRDMPSRSLHRSSSPLKIVASLWILCRLLRKSGMHYPSCDGNPFSVEYVRKMDKGLFYCPARYPFKVSSPKGEDGLGLDKHRFTQYSPKAKILCCRQRVPLLPAGEASLKGGGSGIDNKNRLHFLQPQENGLPRQPAGWLAMTAAGVSRTIGAGEHCCHGGRSLIAPKGFPLNMDSAHRFSVRARTKSKAKRRF